MFKVRLQERNVEKLVLHLGDFDRTTGKWYAMRRTTWPMNVVTRTTRARRSDPCTLHTLASRLIISHWLYFWSLYMGPERVDLQLLC